MDKRSLWFGLAVTIAFFAVQTLFDMKKTSDSKILEVKIQEETVKKRQELEKEVLARTVSLDTLPITSLFADAEGKEYIATGVLYDHFFLTFSQDIEIPSTAYVLDQGTFVALDVIASSPNGPVLLSDKKKKKWELPSLPKDCPVDVQLIAAGEDLRVVLGEQKGEKFSIPFHFLDTPAVAFICDQNQFLPVGIYDPESKKVKTFSELQNFKTIVKQEAAASVPASRGEEFYVLENEYQQLVFSTLGGALVEINLPLKSKANPASIVKEIDFDRQILANSPRNAEFPLRPYYAFGNSGKELHQTGQEGGYYPLLRRPIFNSDGTQKTMFPAEYYACNIVSEDPSVAKLVYRVTHFSPESIRFEAKTSERRIIKTFSILKNTNGPYCFELNIQIDGDARNLWLTSGLPDVELIGGSYSPLLRTQTEVRNNTYEVSTVDLPKKIELVTSVEPNWISNNNGFLGIITDPLIKLGSGYRADRVDGAIVPTRLSIVDPGFAPYPPENFPAYATALPLRGGVEIPFRIFAGPFDEHLLKALDAKYKDKETGYSPDYASAQRIQGWFSFISEPLVKLLFFLMHLFYKITGSWAFSIILLTISLRAMMYPLNAWSIKSSLRMQQIAPKVKLVQEKFKKDPKRAQLEVMNLYKTEGVNPMTGCLPMLLQMPFWIGMFYLLKSSFPLRGAPFIPGWIDDLAAPDILFSWGQPIWFIGNEFHLLPILMGASMYLQQKLTSPTPKNPVELSDAQKQQKMMGTVMSIFLVVMFYNFPSGLNLYSMFSTLLGVLQQWWMSKKMNSIKV